MYMQTSGMNATRNTTALIVLAFGLMAGAAAHAEVLELEGTIKAIDAASRSITIVRKTPKGEKLLELEVAKNAGDISGFKEGDSVAFAYNPDVDIISKIETTGQGSVREFADESPVMAVAFHPNGNQVASGCRSLSLWNLKGEGEKAITLKHAPLKELPHVYVTSVAISPTGKMLASAANDGSVRLWDISGSQPKERDVISKNTGVVTPIRFSPDGTLLATAERASGITRLFDVSGTKAKPTQVLAPVDGDVWSLSFSPDGKTLAVGMWFNEVEPKYGEVVLWDLTRNPATRTVLVPKTGLPRDIQFMPDGKSIAFGDRGLVRQISVPDGESLRVFDCFPSDLGIVAVAVSPNGKYLAAGGTAKSVKVLEVTACEDVGQLSEDFKGVEGLAFSPDGTSLLIGSKDSKVRVWTLSLGGE
jgi:WD40 repeat protein